MLNIYFVATLLPKMAKAEPGHSDFSLDGFYLFVQQRYLSTHFFAFEGR